MRHIHSEHMASGKQKHRAARTYSCTSRKPARGCALRPVTAREPLYIATRSSSNTECAPVAAVRRPPHQPLNQYMRRRVRWCHGGGLQWRWPRRQRRGGGGGEGDADGAAAGAATARVRRRRRRRRRGPRRRGRRWRERLRRERRRRRLWRGGGERGAGEGGGGKGGGGEGSAHCSSRCSSAARRAARRAARAPTAVHRHAEDLVQVRPGSLAIRGVSARLGLEPKPSRTFPAAPHHNALPKHAARAAPPHAYVETRVESTHAALTRRAIANCADLHASATRALGVCQCVRHASTTSELQRIRSRGPVEDVCRPSGTIGEGRAGLGGAQAHRCPSCPIYGFHGVPGGGASTHLSYLSL